MMVGLAWWVYETLVVAKNAVPLFIRVHNETLSVIAMCVCNPVAAGQPLTV